ncbi:G2/mitotic-specific cyclin-B2 [Planococcus citri]|uniref:G2/mitotic-specific cyclin-B2 n=1 Tax=Planococcus citri TaxID=170843 RepID=UPI0031F81FE0
METRIQRPVFSVSDENAHVVGLGKMNANKTGKDVKRAALGDIANNRLPSAGLNQSILPKSKLPVLKPGFNLTKTKSTTVSKSKLTSLKENQVPGVVPQKSSNLKTIIDKTRTLKIQHKKPVIERPPGVEDIDKDDAKNPFLLSAYTMDIYEYLRSLERSHPIKEDYLKDHKEITPKMRAIVVDWLVEVQLEYRLLQETLHITVGILDTYLQSNPKVDKNKMQLIGIAALFLATKYEEITVPSADELVYISASAFKERDLYLMEMEMFKKIGFDISRPISLNFLRRFSKAAFAHAEHHTYAKYFLELALIEYKLCHIHPSLVAAAALYLALFVKSTAEEIDESLWTKTLEYYSGYKMDDIKPILLVLAKTVYNARTSKLQSVVQKYATSKLFKVSMHAELYSDRMKKLASQ